MTTFKVGKYEIMYTPIKPKEYVAPVVINSAMGIALNPKGNISGSAINLIMIMFIYKFVSLAKKRDIGKLLDLTIKYGITVFCFYILPYVICKVSKGILNVDCVREVAYELVKLNPLMLEG